MILAFVVFAGFLAILAIEVPSPDLIAVILLTLVLVAWDFLSGRRGKSD
jgi:hypothetical protein